MSIDKDAAVREAARLMNEYQDTCVGLIFGKEIAPIALFTKQPDDLPKGKKVFEFLIEIPVTI